MRFRLLTRFILVYVLIAVTTFVLISTVGSRLVEKRITDIESRRLYREATEIADELSALSAG